jgi:hypothetical protein
MQILLVIATMILGILFSPQAHAVCPVCTVSIAGGLGVSRWLGIDDIVPGIWIGGLILSMGFWFSDWIKGRDWKFRLEKLPSVFIFYLITLTTLYVTNTLFLPGNTLWGIDKILLGMVVGSPGFYIGNLMDQYLRKVNEGKVLFYYQRVILPVTTLSILSFVFYLITK